jgi:hypothetical protein
MSSSMRACPATINAATAQLTIKIGSDSDELMHAARLRAEAYYEVHIFKKGTCNQRHRQFVLSSL